MTQRQFFGTDGIRGRANQAPMTVESAVQLGRAVATHFRRQQHRPKVLVGKDTRLSCYMLEAALIAGITSTGADVVAVGPVPTPGIAFLTTSMRADAGIVISASHNPYDDNGLKVFGHDGFKLPDDVELLLEELMEHPERCLQASGAELGRVRRVNDANGRYVTHVKRMLQAEFDLEGMKIVVDCANGAAYRTAPLVFSELGAEVIALGVAPNGLNINERCGSMHPEGVVAAVLEHGADIGVALDGDADRLILVDERGNVVDGDAVLGLCATHLAAQDRLPHRTVVATQMSNLGLEHYLDQHGIRLERTLVGDRYVVQRMREGGFTCGGEQSGHMVFLEHATTGDGLVAAVQVLNVLLATQRPLSDLAGRLHRVPQLLHNERVACKPPLETLPRFQSRLAAIEQELGRRGRVLVRYSGTESKVRVMVEAEDAGSLRPIADELSALLRDEIAAIAGAIEP